MRPFTLLLGLCAAACGAPEAHPTATGPTTAPHAARKRASPSRSAVAPKASSVASAAPVASAASARSVAGAPSGVPAVPPLPSGEVAVAVPGDREVLVHHAPRSVTRVIVYLHGVCGNIHATSEFSAQLVQSATLVALHGDARCGRSDRFKWTSSTAALEARIERALDAVKVARDGALDTTSRVVFGYSQGATRALGLVRQFPDRYPWVMLGGAPSEPDPALLTKARVLVIASQYEPRETIEHGYAELARRGVVSRYVLLPGASHGRFGSQASDLVGSAVMWLLGVEPSGKPT